MWNLWIHRVGNNRTAVVGELIERVYEHFAQAPLSYGHGTDNAWDEAVYLVLCHGYADDEASLHLPVASADQQHIQQLTTRRIEERAPLAHSRRMPFYGPTVLVEPG